MAYAVSPSWLTLIMGTLGILPNLVSCSFFLRKISRRSSLGDMLLVLLNISDLIVCILCSAKYTIILVLYRPSYLCDFPYLVILGLNYNLWIQLSALITTTLGIVRYFHISSPFIKVKKSLIFVALVVASCGITAGEIYWVVTAYNCSQIPEGVWVYTLVPMVILAILFNTLTVLVLKRNVIVRKTTSTNTNINASKTIVILLTVFVITNLLFVVLFQSLKNRLSLDSISLVCSLIPINSAVNPVVYITRNKELNDYVTEPSRKLFRGSIWKFNSHSAK